MKEMQLYPEVRNALESLGCAVSKIPGSTYNMGLPDFIATYKGRAVHIEVKIVTSKRAGKATALQLAHLERHNAAGACCFVLTYHEDMHAWTARWKDLDSVGHRISLPQIIESMIRELLKGGDI